MRGTTGRSTRKVRRDSISICSSCSAEESDDTSGDDLRGTDEMCRKRRKAQSPAGYPMRKVKELRQRQVEQGEDLSGLTPQQMGNEDVQRLHHISVNRGSRGGPLCFRVRVCKSCSRQSRLIELGTYSDKESAVLVNDSHEILCGRTDKLHVLVPSDRQYFGMLTATVVFRGHVEEKNLLEMLKEKMCIHQIRADVSSFPGALSAIQCEPEQNLDPRSCSILRSPSVFILNDDEESRLEPLGADLKQITNDAVLPLLCCGLFTDPLEAQRYFYLLVDAVFNDIPTTELRPLSDKAMHIMPFYATKVMIGSCIHLDRAEVVRNVMSRLSCLLGQGKSHECSPMLLEQRLHAIDRSLKERRWNLSASASFYSSSSSSPSSGESNDSQPCAHSSFLLSRVSGLVSVLQTHTWRELDTWRLSSWDLVHTDEYTHRTLALGCLTRMECLCSKVRHLLQPLASLPVELGNTELLSSVGAMHAQNFLQAYVWSVCVYANMWLAAFTLEEMVVCTHNASPRYLLQELVSHRYLDACQRSVCVSVWALYLETLCMELSMSTQHEMQPDSLRDSSFHAFTVHVRHLNVLLGQQHKPEALLEACMVYLRALYVLGIYPGQYGEQFSLQCLADAVSALAAAGGGVHVCSGVRWAGNASGLCTLMLESRRYDANRQALLLAQRASQELCERVQRRFMLSRTLRSAHVMPCDIGVMVTPSLSAVPNIEVTLPIVTSNLEDFQDWDWLLSPVS